MDPVGALGGLIRRYHHHAVGASLLCAVAVGVEAHDDFAAAVAQVLRLRVSLAAVAQDGDGFALQGLGIRVVLVKNGSHWEAPRSAGVPPATVGRTLKLVLLDSEASRPVGRLLRNATFARLPCQARSRVPPRRGSRSMNWWALSLRLPAILDLRWLLQGLHHHA